MQPSPGTAAPETPPRIGDPAPEFALRDQGGTLWELERLRGRRVLLLFLCGCQPCREMARGVSRRSRSWRDVQVLVVAQTDEVGSAAFQRDTSLKAPVLTDAFADVAAAYGSVSCPRC